MDQDSNHTWPFFVVYIQTQSATVLTLLVVNYKTKNSLTNSEIPYYDSLKEIGQDHTCRGLMKFSNAYNSMT